MILDSVLQAFQEGYKSFHNFIDNWENPYDIGTEECEAWDAGWWLARDYEAEHGEKICD